MNKIRINQAAIAVIQEHSAGLQPGSAVRVSKKLWEIEVDDEVLAKLDSVKGSGETYSQAIVRLVHR